MRGVLSPRWARTGYPWIISTDRTDGLTKDKQRQITILVEPFEPVPLPYAKRIIRVLKILTICPHSYDGREFTAQTKLLRPILYMSTITALIGITLGFLIVHEEPPEFRRDPLVNVVRYANLSTNLAFNSLTIVIIVWHRHLAVKCLNYVHRLWQIYGPRKESSNRIVAIGILLFLVDTVLIYVIHVVEVFFPLVNVMQLTGIPPDRWVHHFIKVFVAVIVFWPLMCFNAVGVSILLWLALIFGSTTVCLTGLTKDAKEISKEDRVKGSNPKWVQVNRVRDAVSTLDNIAQTAGTIYSVRLFCYFLDFVTRAMEELMIIANIDRTTQPVDRAMRAALLVNETLFLILAMRAISLCALKINDTRRILAENPSSLHAYDLKGVYKKLRYMNVQPSAMGFYKVDLRTLVGMAGSILTYTVVIIQFAQRK